MDSAGSDKVAPSHPFTSVDVEIMRTMRLRLTRRKFRIIIALQALVSFLILLWIAYAVASYATSKNRRMYWMSDWVILVSLLLIVTNIASIFVTVKKYKAALRFLEDPATHPDLIINSEMSSYDGFKPMGSHHKKINV
ncbi:hypothetical protein J3B02_001597 [Coemansia erecta]|uniref:Transmembrane protein n=1 Tax=Coemansia asiatica TaxID=1052880 RepID=A0A9W8CK85_9FUNG|nr:hypothetical protein LPJ64_001866 [Coemansia asiatica]KAJ2856439.1 hypothetical protein J3B02_001597 [Coemansia erecta]KAJ2887950.1 hypothetical protein FB639_000968 [Coemansia asiatica]